MRTQPFALQICRFANCGLAHNSIQSNPHIINSYNYKRTRTNPTNICLDSDAKQGVKLFCSLHLKHHSLKTLNKTFTKHFWSVYRLSIKTKPSRDSPVAIFLTYKVLWWWGLGFHLCFSINCPQPSRTARNHQWNQKWNSWTPVWQKTRVFCSMLFTVPSTGGF